MASTAVPSFLPVNSSPADGQRPRPDGQTSTSSTANNAARRDQDTSNGQVTSQSVSADTSRGSSSHSSADEPPSAPQPGDHDKHEANGVPSNTGPSNEVEMSGTGPDNTAAAATAPAPAPAPAAASSSGPPSKKKKGQRFYCTDYPPCNLNFTRSEHLARHIRKHTGERPFMCHCSRRFSRLDNLRQHAQTVHVNENIPGDSLAATSTRFQRQIRTDRVRPAGRARAGTAAGHSHAHSLSHGHAHAHAHSLHRGHARNLSASSVSSAATFTAELRRRPPPLMMAGANPAAAAAPKTPPAQSAGPALPALPAGATNNITATTATTPSSAATTAPYDLGSPYYASPSSAYGPASFWPDRSAASFANRRLSVPTASRPFDSPFNNAAPYSPFHRVSHPPPPYPQSLAPAPLSVVAPSPIYGHTPTTTTPTSAMSIDSGFETDPRRRTWHPSSYTGFPPRPAPAASSGLWFQQSAEPHHVNVGVVNLNVPPSSQQQLQQQQQQPTRLPGIESFDHAPPLRDRDYDWDRESFRDRDSEREGSPTSGLDPRRHYHHPSHLYPAQPAHNIMTGSAFAPSFNASPRPTGPAEHRRGQLSLDTTLQRTLNRLDLHGGGGNNHNSTPNGYMNGTASSGSSAKDTGWNHATFGDLQSVGSRPSTGAGTGTGPLKEEAEDDAMQEDEGPGPSVPTEPPSGTADGLGRLEALVAVATSENKKT